MNPDQSPRVSIYVEQTLLCWVNSYPNFNHISSLSDLTSGQFFLFVLEPLPNFKLLQPIEEMTNHNNLAAKVSTIKNITRSLIKFHQIQLLRDVSDFVINYVELCLGNCKEIIRLMTMLLSALNSVNATRVLLEHQLEGMEREKSQILRIIIQNSENIGEMYDQSSSRMRRIDDTKKITTTMESLQNRIEQLENLNKKQQQKLKQQFDMKQALTKENAQLTNTIKQLLFKCEQLQETTSKTECELKISRIQETTQKKKIQVVKQNYEEKIWGLEKELSKYRHVEQSLYNLESRIEELENINREIRADNTKLLEELKIVEIDKIELKKKSYSEREEFVKLKEYCGELEVKVEEINGELMRIKNEGDVYKGHYQGMEGDGNCYRVKEKLSHCLSRRNNENMDPNVKESGGVKTNNNFSIRTITEQSFEQSSFSLHQQNIEQFLDRIQQNQSLVINLCDSTFSPKCEHEEEITLLMNTIIELNNNLREAKHQGIIRNDSESSQIKQSRLEKYKKKIERMFSRADDECK